MTRRLKRPAPQPSRLPWRCVLLAVDPAKLSGWALFRDGLLLGHGLASSARERELVAQWAFAEARSGGLPLIVVAETWNARSFKPAASARPGVRAATRLSTATLIGMGASWGRWLEQLEREGELRLDRWVGPKVVRVEPTTWRAVTIGNAGNAASMKLRALQRAQCACVDRGLLPPADTNVADAIVIGQWGCHAGQVGEVLPAAFRGAA
jgi:hypothetical protein